MTEIEYAMDDLRFQNQTLEDSFLHIQQHQQGVDHIKKVEILDYPPPFDEIWEASVL